MLGSPPKIFNPPQQKNKKRFPKFAAVILIIILIASGAVYWLFFSSFFQIKNITFTGMTLDNFDQASLKGQNILFIKISKIESEILASHPEVNQVQIIRGLPDTLKIVIKSNQASLIWQTNNQQYLVNQKGIAFSQLQGQTDLPLVQDNKNLNIQLGQQVASANFIEFIHDLSNKFSDTLGFKIVYFEVNETIFQVEAMTDQGWFIKLDTTRSVADQLDALKQLFAAHKDEIHEYADVRVEGKVFFK